MTRTYRDFNNNNPHYRQINSDHYFERTFEFLSKPENISKMIDESKKARPALEALVGELEIEFPDLLKQKYNKLFIRHSIGAMIKEILEPFGYVPNEPKRLATKNSRFFKTAHTYRFDPSREDLKVVPSYKIVKA